MKENACLRVLLGRLYRIIENGYTANIAKVYYNGRKKKDRENIRFQISQVRVDSPYLQ